MRKSAFFTLLIVTLLFSISLTSFIFYGTNIISRQSVVMEVTLVNTSGYLGLGLSKEYLGFGQMKPGAQTEKQRTILYSTIPAIVNIKIEGPMKDWVSVEKNNFYLTPGNQTEYWIELHPPKDATPGYYKSNLIVTFFKP